MYSRAFRSREHADGAHGWETGSIAALLALLAALGSLAAPAAARTHWKATAAVASHICAPSAGIQHEPGHAAVEYRRGVVLLAFRRGVPGARELAIERAVGACATRTLGPDTSRAARHGRRSAQPLAPVELRVPVGSVLTVLRRLRHHHEVAYAEPDYITHASAIPNDPSFSEQWGDQNTGQPIPLSKENEAGFPEETRAPGTPGADDRVTAAWDVTTGTNTGENRVVIGEPDTGVQYEHPDLNANIWTSAKEINGCPAGTRGFDVLPESKTPCNPSDGDNTYGGHGTHVAGIMGAVGDNGIGVAGVNWHTTILPVKWLDQAASGSTAELIEALKTLELAKQEGVNVRVVNDSDTFEGVAGGSIALKEEIEALGKSNILFVTAAGNTGKNNDTVERYPCDYSLPNEICVTAANNKDELPSWASYGPQKVDLAAPGVSIYSTFRESKYGFLSGGSMASPQVAGTAALLLSLEPSLTPAQLKTAIVGNVDKLPSLSGKVKSGGRLDVCRAIPGCPTVGTPPTVETTGSSAVTPTEATLKGSVNPNGKAVTSCSFEYGTSTSYGTSVPCSQAELGSGSEAVPVSASVTGLTPGTSYHFRLAAANSGGGAHGADRTLTTPPAVPTALTQEVSSLTRSSATLNASVNPNGAKVTSCVFEYGKPPGYGSSAPCSPAEPSGTKAVAVAAAVTGLTAGSEYHFRILATNAAGPGQGEARTFTTPAIPVPLVETTGSATVTQSAATLKGAVNPNGEQVTSCRFEYGTSGAYGTTAPCTPATLGSGTKSVPVSAAIAGLAPNTLYHFRVSATGPGGSAFGVDQTLTTLTAPPTVLTLGASSITTSSATVAASVNPNGAEVSSCEFEYGTSSSYGSRAKCSPAPGSGREAVAVSTDLTGLTANTTYHYRTVASNPKGGGGVGEDRSFTSSAPPSVQTPSSPPPLVGTLPGSIGVLPFQESKPPAVPSVALVGTILGTARSGTVLIRVSCPAGESSCTGSLTLRTLYPVSLAARGAKARRGILILAAVDFTVLGGQAKTLSTRLYHTARALLGHDRLLHVQATIFARDPRGATYTTRESAILRAPASLARHGRQHA